MRIVANKRNFECSLCKNKGGSLCPYPPWNFDYCERRRPYYEDNNVMGCCKDFQHKFSYKLFEALRGNWKGEDSKQ
jgi:hypothetical protein